MSEDAWTEEDDALLQYEALPDWHPAVCVDVFRAGLQTTSEPGMDTVLRAMVTPESLDSWGDFSSARAFANRDDRMSLRPLYGRDAPDVAYLKFVANEGAWFQSDPTATPPTAFATIVWRPDAAVWHPESRWLVHSIGEAVPPDEVPRTAIGFDPRR